MKLLILALWTACLAAAQTFAGSKDIDAAIEQAIRADEIPGAVALIQNHGKTIHFKAYGLRSLETREPMTTDTIFDAASLTKVVATTASVMKLFEQGRFRLSDRVTYYLPEFQHGQSEITVWQLMTHFSGLRPDLDLKPAWSGYSTGIHKAMLDAPIAPPGSRFIYSDINFILMGEIVHRLSGKLVSEYARDTIFKPLGMNETMFQPPESLRPRIAPTEKLPGQAHALRGVVHDETTRFMGGVAGHAGLFTTAADLGRFAQMMLDLGEANGVRLFSPLTVRKFTTPETPPDQAVLRGFGWDIDSQFSGNRGELFPIGSYGHTGFTGTSLWIDPTTQTSVVLLTNSVHPRRRPAITSLRGRIATITAAALGVDVPGVALTSYNETLAGAGIRRTVARNGQVQTGLEVLAADRFALLRGKQVGLITNQTGLDRNGKRNVDLMIGAGIHVVALLSPEHGMSGKEDKPNIGNSKDAATGLPIFSLYSGNNRRPTDEMLRGVDTLVYDIQDVGARFYTYSCTLIFSMVEASKRKIPFIVLDRPNPITGVHVEGPLLESELQSFVGCYDLPVRHGMTYGELAGMVNGEQKFNADLRVIPMKGWQRGDWFDATGLPWIDPSPNMRSLNAALLYPGIAMLEASTNYSVGRGTDAPFEQVGADWIHGTELAAYLNGRHIPGVRVYPTKFRPTSSNFSGKLIEGVRFVITVREAFDSSRLGLEVGSALEKLYPGKIPWDANRYLIGNRLAIANLRSAADPRLIQQQMEEALSQFLARREKFLLYK